MKIISWNVNGLRAVERKGDLESFLKNHDSDIFLIQETKLQEHQTKELREKYSDYEQFYHSAEKPGYAGTAIWVWTIDSDSGDSSNPNLKTGMPDFAYNETIAQEYFPITKDFAKKLGWRWMEEDQKEFIPQKYKVPAKVSNVDESILKEILACEKCGRNYKVTGQELAFYQKHTIPVPGQCPECRHARRFALKKTLPYHT